MIPAEITDQHKAAMPWARFIDFGPPAGVSDESCGHAGALVEEDILDRAFPDQIHLPMQLEEGELAALQRGEPVWVSIAGRSLAPFAVNVGPTPPVMR